MVRGLASQGSVWGLKPRTLEGSIVQTAGRLSHPEVREKHRPSADDYKTLALISYDVFNQDVSKTTLASLPQSLDVCVPSWVMNMHINISVCFGELPQLGRKV